MVSDQAFGLVTSGRGGEYPPLEMVGGSDFRDVLRVQLPGTAQISDKKGRGWYPPSSFGMVFVT